MTPRPGAAGAGRDAALRARLSPERLLELPKVELHVHLEGSWNVDTLLALARRNRVSLPADTPEGMRRAFHFQDFEHFVSLYLACSRCLRRPEDFQLLVLDFMREQARQNVLWSEAHFTIGTHVGNGGNAREIGEAMWEAMQQGERAYGVRLRLIPDIVRNLPYRWADLTTEWALDFRDRGVVALGLSGFEKGHRADAFAEHFAAVRDAGLHGVAHAGELDGPASVRSALDSCRAERIGHGVRAIEDPELVALLRERRVPLEVCPTSNLRLGIYPDLAAHPFHRLYREGVRVTVGSDDPTFFETTLTDEYRRLVEQHGYGEREVRGFVEEALAAAFVPAALRPELEREVRERLDAALG